MVKESVIKLTAPAMIRAALDKCCISERELARRTGYNVSYVHYSAVVGKLPMSQTFMNRIGHELGMVQDEVLCLKLLVIVEHSKLTDEEKKDTARRIVATFLAKNMKRN